MTEHPPAKRVPGRLLGYAALGLCAAIALYYSLHSLHLAATLTRSMPYHDHWMWVVSDYFHYLDGRYSVWRLFAQVGESEHRLLTTKLVLFADAILFQMRGVFPTALMYFCLAGVAFMLARLAVQPVSWPAQIAAFIVLLAITWSLAQYRDLSWQYEVQFPLLHVFALAGLYAFAIGLSTDDSNRYLWFAVAFLCDFLTAWSGGSGILLTVSLVLLVIWLLRADRAVAIFFFAHLAMLAVYFLDYRFDIGLRHLHGFPGWERYLHRMILYTAWPIFQLAPDVGWRVGVLALAALVVMTVTVTVTVLATRRPLDRNLAVLLAFATFVIIEGALIAYTRNNILARHATMPVIFAATLMATSWRYLSLSAIPELRWSVLGFAMLTIVAFNHDSFEEAWRSHSRLLDETIANARAGDLKNPSMRELHGAGWLPDAILRLKENRLGPFADER